MILFSGTSNPQLAQKVANDLHVSLGRVEVTRFIDSECRVRILDDVKDQDVFVLQSLSQIADQYLVELCLFATALKSMGAKKIIAVIPWMGYSKQDKAFRYGEAISMQLVAKMIEAAGFDNVITVELHSESIKKYFQISITELSTQKLFITVLKRPLPLLLERGGPALSAGRLMNLIVISPDKGGQSRSEKFARKVDVPIIYLDKIRDKETGKVRVTGISGDVANHEVIIFDDIINTGATAAETSVFLKDKGATSVIFLATHAVLAGDASEVLLKSTIDQIIVTNTIAIPKEKLFSSLTVVSVASLLSDAIKQNLG